MSKATLDPDEMEVQIRRGVCRELIAAKLRGELPTSRRMIVRDNARDWQAGAALLGCPDR